MGRYRKASPSVRETTLNGESLLRAISAPIVPQRTAVRARSS
jgi:hypothetical protein